MKDVMRFGKKEKFSPRFIGPFEVLDIVGEVAYRLTLHPSLSAVHLVFHILMLKRYRPDDSHVIRWDSVLLDPYFTFEGNLIAILDRQTRRLRSKNIDSVKVQWRHRSIEEAMWEVEYDMQSRYPQLFGSSGHSTSGPWDS